ncbi:MAG: 1-deoxy-D-xylulose-5-phosphate reductoisomerase [Rhodospirillaceae bacterium]|nr:1-deoxy-D-xylulose-5-phosphate reductoisomerase [Rhodospirillaceae bacterium]
MKKVKERKDTGPRRISILGSTGSIGCNTIDLISRNPDQYRVEALTANRNVKTLAQQARETRASVAVVADESKYADLKEALAGTPTEAAAGADALVEAADRDADWVMAGIVGAAGLLPTLTAVRRGAFVALANKECLVCAGDLVMEEVKRSGATLLPVDSEHNAIFQVFDFDQRDKIEKIILTASGGPFWNTPLDIMAKATPEEAVAHPNWDMGAKISVDSATMMNKGLELIEAHHLFALPEDQIDILVHPQSIVHSLVAYVDGSVLAQLGSPDMRTPIAFALGWPKRMKAPSARLNLAQIGTLQFEQPDAKRFPSIDLARQALREGGVAPTVLNAANEIAVASFLAGEIGFLDIAKAVEDTLASIPGSPLGGLNDVMAADAEARRVAREHTAACTVSA